VKDRAMINHRVLTRIYKMLRQRRGVDAVEFARSLWFAYARFTVLRQSARMQLKRMLDAISGGKPVVSKVLREALSIVTAPELPSGAVSYVQKKFNEEPTLSNLAAIVLAGQRPDVEFKLYRDAVDTVIEKYGAPARYLLGDDTVPTDVVIATPETWVLVRNWKYVVVERPRKKKSRKKKKKTGSTGAEEVTDSGSA